MTRRRASRWDMWRAHCLINAGMVFFSVQSPPTRTCLQAQRGKASGRGSERRVKSHFFPLKHSVLERKRSVASASAVPGASTDLFDAGRAVRRKQFESNEQAVRYCSEICDSLKYWIPPRVMNNADAARRGLKAISYERKMIRGKSYPPSSPYMSSQTHTIGREWQKREYAPPTQSARPV